MVDEERRAEGQRVSDRPVEIGIRLNNVLLALVVAVMSWVGLNIEKLKDEVAQVVTAATVNHTEISDLRRQMADHIEEFRRYKETRK